MFDYNQNPHLFSDASAVLDIPATITAQVESRAYWDNQTVEIRLQSSYDAPLDWTKYKVRWSIENASAVERVHEINGCGVARVPMPRVERAKLLPLRFQLIDAAGYEYVSHAGELLILPSRAAQARFNGAVALKTVSGAERAMLQQLNYAVEDSITAHTEVVISNSSNAQTLDWVRSGGKMLFVSEADAPPFWRHRRTSNSESSWITNSSWLRPDVHPNLPADNPLRLASGWLKPAGIIDGLPQAEAHFEHDYLAGCLSGWVQRSRIHTVQFTYGRGTVIMTTYPLLESLRFGHPDPMGIVMLNDLVGYLGSDDCKPTLSVQS